MRRLLLLLAAGCASAPRSAATPAETTALVLGQSITGNLTPDAPAFADGSHYRAYPFTGASGDTITAELSSVDFDAYVIITDGHGNRLAGDDDSGGTCNASLTYVLPRAGPYRIYAGSAATSEIGAFTLALRRGGSVAPADTVCRGFGRVQGMIRIGQTIQGTLTADDPVFSGDSSYFQRWIVPVTTGQTFSVDLSSTEFDAYLLLTYGGSEKVLENDDGGGACNARLVYVPSDNRPLRILVNTAKKHETGRYTLRVTAGREDIDQKGQCLNP